VSLAGHFSHVAAKALDRKGRRGVARIAKENPGTRANFIMLGAFA